MRERADLLLEVGCEEIPAGMIARAAEELQVTLDKFLTTESLLDGGGVEAFGGPRRLVAIARGLRLRQEDVTREVIGPPKSVAFDNVGQPTRAAESFARKQGVPTGKIYLVSTEKGEYVAAKQVVKGRSAGEILAELVPRAMSSIPWPRSMYWTGLEGMRFIRPIRWVVALLGNQVVRLEVGGVKANRFTRGHRFLGSASVRVTTVADFERKLKKNFVLVRPGERRKRIESELSEQARKTGLRVHDDAGLANLVVYLNEYPSVIKGDFDPAFLELPQEILITVMRDHQKYFALEKKNGELAPHFLAVINLDRDRKGLVRAGHERVLRARFADAKFFWETDQKCRLADYLPKLAHVTYESRLGSYVDKVERIRWLGRWLAEHWFAQGLTHAHVSEVDRAAELAKCDLVTEMVKEFTELQGIVGGLYAKAQEEPEEVAWAVYDHYRPVGLEDPIPRNLTGCALALADKLDALVGCFAVGMLPTGSSDPFALRRAALGVVKIILERKLPVSLAATVAAAGKALGQYPPKIQVTPKTEGQVLEFIVDRAKFVLREKMGFAYDEVNAALAAGADDLVDAARRIEAIRAIRRSKNFEPLAVSFKRIRKILEKAGNESEWRLKAVQPEKFAVEAEASLYKEARRVAEHVERQKKEGRYKEALEVIADLRPVVDRFFVEVLVMAEEEPVRKNRLTLLAGLLREFSTIADFSEIAAEERKN